MDYYPEEIYTSSKYLCSLDLYIHLISFEEGQVKT